MTETEKSYIAGIIDGEGSIMLKKVHANEHPTPVVSITSTTIELLHWIKSTVGKGTITKKTNYNIEKHKDCYTYVVRRDTAIQLLKYIYTYLIINAKRQRCELIIKEYKSITPRNGRYSLDLLEMKKDFYKRFINIK